MRKVAIALCAIGLVGLTPATALAGEMTGNGKSLKPLQGRSICAYSGLNDDPLGLDGGTPGRTQSFGQEVRGGSFHPRQANPGMYCNPNAMPPEH